MKVYLIFACLLLLVGCGESDGNNPTTTTTLTISNESFSELTNVTWHGVSFADNFDPLTISGSIKKTVQSGEGYIFFNRKSNPIVARTRELVVVEEGKDNTFRFHDNTFIVEASNPDNTGTLKDLNSTPTGPATTELTADTKAAFSTARNRINNGAAGTYTITITGSISLDYFESFSGTGKKIIIKGDTISRQIFNDDFNPGSVMFSVPRGITLELGNNITLNGNDKDGNTVVVEEGGTFIMNNGSTISSCKNYGIESSGTFTMNGGTISGNSYNTNFKYGGGVIIHGGTFSMNGGTISDNSAYGHGGGVHIEGGTFVMSGGTISGNISGNPEYSTYGGGVYVGSVGSFIKTGGTIDETNVADVGKVAYNANGTKKRETAAGPTDNLDSSKTGAAGGWE
ncbi:hypothetical protein [Treponema sp. R80B11-R83G3]